MPPDTIQIAANRKALFIGERVWVREDVVSHHRVRFAFGDKPNSPKLSGVVEVDETFVGGSGESRTRFVRQTPVVALIEQGGKMKTRVVASVGYRNLGNALAFSKQLKFPRRGKEFIQKRRRACSSGFPH